MAEGTCQIEGCEQPSDRRGWCNRHYIRWRRHGDPLGGGPEKINTGLTNPICLIGGCDGPRFARGWCQRHYIRWRTHGDPMMTLRPNYDLSLQARLWAGIQQTDGCWPWTGGKHRAGYGVIRDGGDTVLTHRLMWVLTFGPIPKGMDVCHRCDNPPCCRPGHLFVGTREDNVHDMIDKGRAAWQKATRSEG
jgi:hypothetical protein